MVGCLAACSGGDGDLRLDCVGERQLLRGNLEEPTNGVRRVKEEKQQVFELQGHKLEGQHACQVWTDKEIRCTHQKTDGSLQRQFRLDRESLRVRDQTLGGGIAPIRRTQEKGRVSGLLHGEVKDHFWRISPRN